MRRIYFDHNATTPVHPEVAAAVQPFLGEHFGNPSSIHWAGRDVRKAVEDARAEIAAFYGCRPLEVVFTSSGTEADNLAVIGVAHRPGNAGKHIVTSQVEHPAIMNTCRFLESQGFRVTYVPVNRQGIVEPDAVRSALTKDTILVSVMAANNEIGTIQPVAALGALCRERGVIFHTDAVQWFGKEAFDSIQQFNADLVSSCAHKFHGPKGVGALFVRSPLQPRPILLGGGHENGRRAGTENVAGIVGFAEAVERFIRTPVFNRATLTPLSNRLLALLERTAGARFLGSRQRRLANTVSFLVEGADSIALLAGLDLEGICASGGSACASGSLQLSHVVTALGVEAPLGQSLVRLSLGRESTLDDVQHVESIFPSLMGRAQRGQQSVRVR